MFAWRFFMPIQQQPPSSSDRSSATENVLSNLLLPRFITACLYDLITTMWNAKSEVLMNFT